MEIATQNSSSISFIAITHFPPKYNAKLQTAKSLINKKQKFPSYENFLVHFKFNVMPW